MAIVGSIWGLGFVAQGRPGGSSSLLVSAIPAAEPAPPTAWISLSACDPGAIPGTCADIPDVLVALDDGAVDPSSYVIYVSYGSREVSCPAPTCAIKLEETPFEGIELQFWAKSPEDNRKITYTARVRVLPADDTSDSASVPWYVQVLSTQWVGEPVDACAVAWDTFPPVGAAARWLETPGAPEHLASDVMYHYLAGRLIAVGAVDIGECPDGGLTEDGAPSACGAEKANAIVRVWQNRFDGAILDAARRTRIPATLVKAVIAEESQFWPASIPERGEYGLGHLTEQGADNTLLWNKEFYDIFCQSVLGETYCGKGYAHQSDYRRALLRGSLLARVDADCQACDWGVELGRAREGVRTLTETLRAYCVQAGRMVANVTREAPGRGTSYEDMWRLTLASYAAGPGCVAEAMKAASKKGELISWSSVSNEFSIACSGALDYLDHVAR